MMGAISDDAIRVRAYDIWEREGRPQGRDFEHWVRAQVELIAESTNNTGQKAAAVARTAKAKGAAPSPSAKGPAPKPSRPGAARAGRAKKPA